AINIIRKKPQAPRSYDLFYRGGRFNTHQAGAGATGRVFNLARLLYRVDTSFEHSDAWRSAGTDRFNISPSINWLIGERARLTITEAVNHDNFKGDAGVPVGVLDLRSYDLSRRFNTPWDFAHFRDSQSNVLLTISLPGNFELRNSFFYRYTNDQY